jgi:ATP-dependent DNA ligase
MESVFSAGRLRTQRRSVHWDGDVLFAHACKLGCEGIVSKRLGSVYRSGRSQQWLKIKNPAAPAVRRGAEEDWGRISSSTERFTHSKLRRRQR